MDSLQFIKELIKNMSEEDFSSLINKKYFAHHTIFLNDTGLNRLFCNNLYNYCVNYKLFGDSIEFITHLHEAYEKQSLKIVVLLEFPSGIAYRIFLKNGEGFSTHIKSLLEDIVWGMTIDKLNKPSTQNEIVNTLFHKINTKVPEIKISNIILGKFIIQQ